MSAHIPFEVALPAALAAVCAAGFYLFARRAGRGTPGRLAWAVVGGAAFFGAQWMAAHYAAPAVDSLARAVRANPGYVREAAWLAGLIATLVLGRLLFPVLRTEPEVVPTAAVVAPPTSQIHHLTLMPEIPDLLPHWPAPVSALAAGPPVPVRMDIPDHGGAAGPVAPSQPADESAAVEVARPPAPPSLSGTTSLLSWPGRAGDEHH